MHSSLFAAGAFVAAAAISPPAVADDVSAQAFIASAHAQIATILHDATPGDREAKVRRVILATVDMDEVSRRAFGQPCPAAEPTCENHFARFDEAQSAEVVSLVGRVVERTCRRWISLTSNYDVSYKRRKGVDGDVVVRTEARSRERPHEPPIRIDYVVRRSTRGYRVVDVVTEGASLTQSFYDQFHRMLAAPEVGYAGVVTTLRDRVAHEM